MACRVRGEGGRGLSRVASPGELGRAADAGATEHYEDPVYYDQVYSDRRDDVAHYVRLGRLSRGPVLEYGVGTGRIALALARAGIAVTGVDLSPRMLARFRERLSAESPDVRRRIRLVRGDMRTTRLDRRFPLVIAPFNTVQHLYDRRDMERFLARVRDHLAPRGRLVFDVLVPHADYLGADPERRFGAPRFRYPGRGLVRYAERFEYDALRQVLLMRLDFRPEDGSRPWTVPLTHRQWFPAELEAILHYNGFRDIDVTEDFTDAQATPSADSLVVSCRAAKVRDDGRAKGTGRRRASAVSAPRTGRWRRRPDRA